MKLRPILLLAILSMAHATDHDAARTVEQGLRAATEERRPVLLDFQAQWCYSCYYMATHVLTGAAWQDVERRVHVIDVDADSPDGANWMKRLNVKTLPAYVVIKTTGPEYGRIVGEQPASVFYPLLERILAGSDALDALKRKAMQGSSAAAADALASFFARGENQPGLDWYAALPAERRAALGQDPNVALWHDRLQLEVAAKAEDSPACVATARRVLDAAVGCDRYYVLENLLSCSEKLPAAERKTLLAPQRPALDKLLAKQVFVATPQCADQRTAVMVAADLDKAIEDPRAETAVLNHAIADVRGRLAGNYARDRNLADNLRVYLQRADRMAEFDALMPKLMAAYPDDYVYAYRYGRSLLERKRPADALPYLEQAAAKTYGANRLQVATARVEALLALNRRDDANKVAAEALEQNGPWFGPQAAKLKALVRY